MFLYIDRSATNDRFEDFLSLNSARSRKASVSVAAGTFLGVDDLAACQCIINSLLESVAIRLQSCDDCSVLPLYESYTVQSRTLYRTCFEIRRHKPLVASKATTEVAGASHHNSDICDLSSTSKPIYYPRIGYCNPFISSCLLH